MSVIMGLHDQFELTLMALGSLRANYAGEIELILVDSGSSDETRYIERYVPGDIFHVDSIVSERNIFTRGLTSLSVASAFLSSSGLVELTE